MQSMTKWHVKKRAIAAAVLVAGVLGAVVAIAVAQSQRFSDVPPDHAAYEAVEWAAEVGVTAGYTDGTFKPEEALSRRHARVFLERFYDGILGADGDDSFKHADFIRGDMMILLKAINDGGSTETSESGTHEPTTTQPPADDEVEAIHSYDRIQNLDPPGGVLDVPFGAASESTNVWNDPLFTVAGIGWRAPRLAPDRARLASLLFL